MPYPGQFHRLVIIGNVYADVWNTTLSIVPTSGTSVPAATQALADDLLPVIQTWWNLNTGDVWAPISAWALTGIKVNRIGPDGRYVDNEAIEATLTTPDPGPGAGTPPPQIALVGTIRGANERQRAGRGRMYLPPPPNALSLPPDGRLSIGTAQALAHAFHNLLQNIGGVYIDSSVNALPGIASNAGAGAFQVMSRVSVGRTPDTVRSRRSKQQEDPIFWPS